MIADLGQRRLDIADDVFIADSADVIGSVSIASGCSVWFQAVIRGDNDQITIGEDSNVQDSAVLHTDPGFHLVLGTGVSIGHMAMIHGCEIGDGSLVGINSVILNGAKIGANCLIGANTLVTEGKEIPPRSLVMGSPGKIVRELNDEQVEGLLATSRGYRKKARIYRSDLRVR